MKAHLKMITTWPFSQEMTIKASLDQGQKVLK